jgi:hypothetical protein
MRWGIFLSLVTVSVCLAAHAAFASEPAWALVSTEVNDSLDASGTFMDRQVLQLWPPTWTWSGSSSDVFFDPGDVFGIETGLDAFDMAQQATGSLLYFSTEVDFDYDGTAYQDEDLLVYDTSSGLVGSAFDVKDVLGADYGLDAACWIYEPHDAKWILAFSTEVGGQYWEQDESGGGSFVPFTDGDVLVTDGSSIVGMLSLEEVFGRNVGLDALHGWIEESDLPDYEYELQILLSTEVDGSLPVLALTDQQDPENDFKDQDIVMLRFALGEGPGPLIDGEVAWRGIDDGFGKDVGLDALYVYLVPEPATVLLAGLGVGALALRLRRKK